MVVLRSTLKDWTSFCFGGGDSLNAVSCNPGMLDL